VRDTKNLPLERRFLVSFVPAHYETLPRVVVREGYLATDGNPDVKIAQIGRRFSIVTAANGALDRRGDTRLNSRQFAALWPATLRSQSERERTILHWGGFRVALDRFRNPLAGFILARVPIAGGSDGFVPPAWFGPEVTGDSNFTDWNLARVDPEKIKTVFGPLLQPVAQAAGAVPFMVVSGELKVVVITTKSKSRWIFPKGTPDPKLSAEELALVEAKEEAGVVGTLIGTSSEVHYWSGYRCSLIRYFPMKVESLNDNWDERAQRDRRVCTIAEAAGLLADRSFIELLEKFRMTAARTTGRI